MDISHVLTAYVSVFLVLFLLFEACGETSSLFNIAISLLWPIWIPFLLAESLIERMRGIS
jgi:hypothetical protein